MLSSHRKSLLALLAALPLASANAQTVYSNDFQSGAGPEWSDNRLETTIGGNETFLGRFTGSSGFESTLSLTGIGGHTELLVDFDLFILQGWEGDGPSGWGPDSFLVEVDGTLEFDHTFISFGGGWTQSYPIPGSAPGAGSFASSVDGLSGVFYHLSLIVPHTASAADLRFMGNVNPAPGDEAWGIDNVVVTAATGSNGPPNAANDAGYSVVSGYLLDSTQLLGAGSVLSNDSDPDGDALTAVLAVPPANGNVVLNPNGTFQYTPFPGFKGADNFTYQADDGQLLSTPARVDLVVTPLSTGPELYAAYSKTVTWLFDDTAILNRVDLASANLTAIGEIKAPVFFDSIDFCMGMSFAPDGTLYITNNLQPSLHTIDPATALKEYIGNFTPGVHLLAFEGSLAIAEDNTAYVSNINDTDLWTVDLATGLGSYFASLPPNHDINGMTVRNDGKLIALDSTTGWLIVIDPLTMSISPLAPVTADAGSVSGMTTVDDVGYFATGNTVPNWSTGSNQLWRFDLYTGAQSLVGSLSSGGSGEGVAGLAGKDSGLHLAAPAPGLAGVTNTFAIDSAVPGSNVVVSYSLQNGLNAIGPVCPGQYSALGAPNALLTFVPDNAGMASQDLFVPPGAAGLTAFFQAVDAGNCMVSNQVVFTF